MTSSVGRWMTLAACLLLMPVASWAGWDALNMTEGVTEVSRDVYELHMRIFWICCAIGFVVFAVMLISIVSHRKSKGAVAADFHESTTVEIVWTIVPLFILIAMAVPAAKVLIKMEDFSDTELTVKVTGYQWRWQYEYPDQGIAFYSQLHPDHNLARQKGADVDLSQFGDDYLKEVDNPLVLPVGKKVRFLHTAADVIHSWWVPALSVKKDAIPGFINENWAKIDEPGIYRGKCAELCGRDHGFMPVVIRAVPQEEFDAWVAEQQTQTASADTDADRQWEHEALVAAGAEVYQNNCASCHQAEGQGIPGMFPAISNSSVVTGDIDTHLATVMYGVTGTPMQPWGNTLSDVELAAVITYQRNAFGNAVGDNLQPFQVKSLKQGLRQASITSKDFKISGVN